MAVSKSRSGVPRYRGDNPEITRAVIPIYETLNTLATHPFMNGNFLQDVQLVNGRVNRIRHQLGKAYTFYMFNGFVGATATGRIVEQRSSTKDIELSVDVQGWGANITCNLWVF